MGPRTVSYEERLNRVSVDPQCAEANGAFVAHAVRLTPEQVVDQYLRLTLDDIRAALAYAAEVPA